MQCATTIIMEDMEIIDSTFMEVLLIAWNNKSGSDRSCIKNCNGLTYCFKPYYSKQYLKMIEYIAYSKSSFKEC